MQYPDDNDTGSSTSSSTPPKKKRKTKKKRKKNAVPVYYHDTYPEEETDEAFYKNEYAKLGRLEKKAHRQFCNRLMWDEEKKGE